MIHSFKLNGYNVVLDTASGSVHSVDDVAYDIIGMYQGASKDEIVKEITSKYDVTEQDVLDCIDDIEELKKEIALFFKFLYIIDAIEHVLLGDRKSVV